MAFSNRGFGTRDTPRTYAACLWLWENRRSKRHEYITLGYNTRLFRDEAKGTFYATFRYHTIVTYYPDYKVIDACGFSGSPTTQGRISALANVRIYSDASLGFNERVRVNGNPYFAGMRIDNFGAVFEEDRRPDFKTRAKRDVTLRYATLWKRLHRVLLGRWEIGEFKREDYARSWSEDRSQQALLGCEEVFRLGNTFIPHEVAMDLLWGGTTTAPSADLHATLKHRKESLRNWWLLRNDGYETIEVK